MIMPNITDLLDANEDLLIEGKLRIVAPLFRDYGGLKEFNGEIVTLKIFEDNTLVRQTLSEPGQGRVLVVDGGGSLRCALLGDQLGALAVENEWEGIIIYGAVRDSAALSTLSLGIKALNTYPLKSQKRGLGDKNVPVHFGEVRFIPGEWLYADADGIIVSTVSL